MLNVPLKTTTYPLEVLDFSCLFYCFNTRKSSDSLNTAERLFLAMPEHRKEKEERKEKREKSGKSGSEKYLLLTEFEVRTVKPWSNGPPSSRKWTQVELAKRFALGGQTDSQVSTQVHASC